MTRNYSHAFGIRQTRVSLVHKKRLKRLHHEKLVKSLKKPFSRTRLKQREENNVFMCLLPCKREHGRKRKKAKDCTQRPSRGGVSNYGDQERYTGTR